MKKIICIAFTLFLFLPLFGCKAKSNDASAVSVAESISDITSDENGNVIIKLADGRAFSLDGLKGKDGADGKDGKDGKDGANGLNGRDGINGINGVDGKDGRDGVNGKDGKDAIVTSSYVTELFFEGNKLMAKCNDGSIKFIKRVVTELDYEFVLISEFYDKDGETLLHTRKTTRYYDEGDPVDLSFSKDDDFYFDGQREFYSILDYSSLADQFTIEDKDGTLKCSMNMPASDAEYTIKYKNTGKKEIVVNYGNAEDIKKELEKYNFKSVSIKVGEKAYNASEYDKPYLVEFTDESGSTISKSIYFSVELIPENYDVVIYKYDEPTPRLHLDAQDGSTEAHVVAYADEMIDSYSLKWTVDGNVLESTSNTVTVTGFGGHTIKCEIINGKGESLVADTAYVSVTANMQTLNFPKTADELKSYLESFGISVSVINEQATIDESLVNKVTKIKIRPWYSGAYYDYTVDDTPTLDVVNAEASIYRYYLGTPSVKIKGSERTSESELATADVQYLENYTIEWYEDDVLQESTGNTHMVTFNGRDTVKIMVKIYKNGELIVSDSVYFIPAF